MNPQDPNQLAAQLAAGGEASMQAVDAFRKLGEAMRPLVDEGRRFKVSPKKGEMFKLASALKPTTITLEVCKALNLPYPPVLLTYVGQESGAEVCSQFNL